MGRQIFAYILHQEGVADDTALELITAARKIDPDASVTALVTGSGQELEAVCNEVASAYQEIWKIDNILGWISRQGFPSNSMPYIFRTLLTSKALKVTRSKQFARNTAAWSVHI